MGLGRECSYKNGEQVFGPSAAKRRWKKWSQNLICILKKRDLYLALRIDLYFDEIAYSPQI